MPYVVGYEYKNISVRYQCVTPELAFKKLQDFQRFQRANIWIAHPNDQALTEAELLHDVQHCQREATTARC
jgi:hypothetical protein